MKGLQRIIAFTVTVTGKLKFAVIQAQNGAYYPAQVVPLYAVLSDRIRLEKELIMGHGGRLAKCCLS